MMKVIKFYSGLYYYAFAAQTFELCEKKFNEEIGEKIDKWEEIPESEWDEEMINMWEDNDFEKEPFKVSIRQEIVGTDPQLIFTNDLSIID